MRARLFLIAAFAAAATWPAGPAARPAGAHSGGRAQLYVDSLRLEPQPTGWLATLVLRDADSGATEPGLGVHLTASRPPEHLVGPLPLADPSASGHYAAVTP